MPTTGRTGTNEEILKQLDSVERYVQTVTTPFDQTATAAIVAGATLATVGATANAASLDPVLFIGDGSPELNFIAAAPATAMGFRYPFLNGQSIGARLLEMTKIQLGDIEPGGVQIQSSQQLNSIMSAIANTPIAQFPSPVEFSFNIPLLGFNPKNVAAFFGIEEAGVVGSGTAAAPESILVGQDNVGNQGYLAYRIWGTLYDGRRVILDLCDARQSANGGFTLNRQTPTVITLNGKFNSLIVRAGTSLV